MTDDDLAARLRPATAEDWPAFVRAMSGVFNEEPSGQFLDTPSPVAREVSEPGSYGFLDLVATADGTGIRGGVGGDRPSSLTRCSTLACRTSRQRCNGRRASAAHASWDP